MQKKYPRILQLLIPTHQHFLQNRKSAARISDQPSTTATKTCSTGKDSTNGRPDSKTRPATAKTKRGFQTAVHKQKISKFLALYNTGRPGRSLGEAKHGVYRMTMINSLGIQLYNKTRCMYRLHRRVISPVQDTKYQQFVNCNTDLSQRGSFAVSSNDQRSGSIE